MFDGQSDHFEDGNNDRAAISETLKGIKLIDATAQAGKSPFARAGYDPRTHAGHSLRASFATKAARNGATAFDIMRQTSHRSVAIVSRYIREAEFCRD